MPISTPRAVVFDMDGLLIDSEPLWRVAIEEFCARRGAIYTRALAEACTGRGIAYAVGLLAERHGWPVDEEAHTAEITDHFAARVPDAAARTGADALLRRLAGRIPLALGSSSERRLVDAAIAHRGWLPLFDAVVTGDDVEHLKPAPDIFLTAARRLGVEPGVCVVFEDSLAGCRAGRAAGMTVVAVPEGDPSAFADVADLVVGDLERAAHALCLGPPGTGRAGD